jgi:phenylacetate-CoA ligase
MHWEKHIETMSRKKIQELQLKRLQETMEIAYKSVFYKRVFDSIGVKPKDIKCLGDIKKIPFTTKNDLRAAYPYEMLAVEKKKAVRMHSSSGTTGQATVIFYTQEDLDTWTNLLA